MDCILDFHDKGYKSSEQSYTNLLRKNTREIMFLSTQMTKCKLVISRKHRVSKQKCLFFFFKKKNSLEEEIPNKIAVMAPWLWPIYRYDL